MSAAANSKASLVLARANPRMSTLWSAARRTRDEPAVWNVSDAAEGVAFAAPDGG